jgi:hypothetical protein
MRRRIARGFAVVVLACATGSAAITPAAAHVLDTDRFQVALRGEAEHYEDVGRRRVARSVRLWQARAGDR